MSEFILPSLTLLLTLAGLAFGPFFFLAAIATGLVTLGIGSVRKLFKKQFSLDYIAILAMIVALATREFLAGAVISLMILVSESLEAYGAREAEAALKHLVEKIPKTCRVREGDAQDAASYKEVAIQDVREGDVILIREHEIVPLDGVLISPDALVSEANLTGEFEPQPYREGRAMKSGLVNAGPSFALRVSGTFATSTYQKIVGLVQEAKRHPARIVRLAEKYNYGFTAVTLVLAAGAWFLSGGDPTRFLAVLVIATPCPLLIAAPISFLGGLNLASRRNIIVKRPAALEQLAGITTIFFDKTGTLTLGEPTLRAVRLRDPLYTEAGVLAIAAAIELHSLHPLAKAIVRAAQEKGGAPVPEALHVVETVGDGIAAEVHGAVWRLKKGQEERIEERGGGSEEEEAKAKMEGAEQAGTSNDEGGIVIEMTKGQSPVARFILDDAIKPGTMDLLEALRARYRVAILTGDTRENAERLFCCRNGDHDGIELRARCTPEDKFTAIKEAQARGEKVMMVGDGLNDAPALALADVGVVFSGSENSASIDAAAVAILSRDVSLVQATLDLAVRSTRIAEESILWGIGLSIVGMVAAMLGYIPPVTGAILQEGIDASVIVNALRAAKGGPNPARPNTRI